MVKDLAIFGCGGFGREVKWRIDRINEMEKCMNIIGYVSTEKHGEIIGGIPVLGGDDFILNYKKPLDVILAVGSGELRKRIATLYSKNSNISFPNIVALDATIGNNIQMGCGCIITSGCILTTDITLGNFVECNLNCTVGHDCIIKDYVTMFPGAHISGNVEIGECSSIGTGANIIQKLSIGNNTFIGAGATVVKDIPSNCIVVGVPACPKE